MHRSVQNRYAVLAFGTFTFTCVGIIYGWSKFSAAIRADLALNHAQITLAYTISIAMFSLGIALDGLLSRLCSVKTSVTAACLMTGGGFLVSSFLTAGGRFALYAVYGLLVGLGMGIIYGGWLSNIMVWFPGGRGLTTGVLLTAIGFSGLTITPVFASLASAHGWRISFRLIGVRRKTPLRPLRQAATPPRRSSVSGSFGSSASGSSCSSASARPFWASSLPSSPTSAAATHFSFCASPLPCSSTVSAVPCGAGFPTCGATAGHSFRSAWSASYPQPGSGISSARKAFP